MPEKKINLPFAVRLPIILSIGLIVSAILFSTIGLFFIGNYALFLLFLVPLLVLIVLAIREKNIIVFNRPSLSTFLSSNALPLFLFIITFTNFAFIIGSTGWPPVGDALEHGLLTSLLLTNGKIPLTYSPLSSGSMDQALGFHVISANFASLTGILPGQAVYLLAGLILILIPLLAFSIMYIFSSSKVLSTIVFLSAFAVAGPNMEYYLTGFFYNGPYPNIFGFLGVLLFVSIEALRTAKSNDISAIKFSFLSVIVLIGIAIVYPPFVVLPLLYSGLLYGKSLIGNICKIFKIHWKLLLIVLSIFVLFLFLMFFSNGSISFLSMIIEKLQKISLRNFSISDLFLASPLGLFTIVALAISFFCFYKGIWRQFSLFFLILGCFSILSSSLSPVSQYFSIFMPRRIVPVLFILAWIMTLVFISYLFSNENESFKLKLPHLHSKIKIKSAKIIAVSLILVTLILSPTVFSNFTFGNAARGWYQLSYNDDNYKVLQWIKDTVSDRDLILNDYSYPSQFLLSFSIKNVTCTYHLSNGTYQRAVDCNNFWKSPQDYQTFYTLSKRYNVSYVLVTSVPGYTDWLGSGKYIQKPFGTNTSLVFDKNPFVELVYSSGLAAVYKVKHLDLDNVVLKLPSNSSLVLNMSFSSSGLNNSQVINPHWINTEDDRELFFNETYVPILNDRLDDAESLTVVTTFNMASSPLGDMGLVTKGGGWGTQGFSVYVSWSDYGVFRVNDLLSITTEPFKIPLNSMVQLAAVYNDADGMASIYLNGVKVAVNYWADSIHSNDFPINIGRIVQTNSNYFLGNIDNVQIYDCSLKDQEITALYTQSIISKLG